ncbi:hypothetical protein ACFT25_15780 [Streptomyces hydrogenans]|uniref:hypothetical protein n=1 Tax=Streptomyces hydrogenans TaxID=1873719 RepID=UPI00362C0BBB
MEHEVNTYVFQSAFGDVERAWKNWLGPRLSARVTRTKRLCGASRPNAHASEGVN